MTPSLYLLHPLWLITVALGYRLSYPELGWPRTLMLTGLSVLAVVINRLLMQSNLRKLKPLLVGERSPEMYFLGSEFPTYTQERAEYDMVQRVLKARRWYLIGALVVMFLLHARASVAMGLPLVIPVLISLSALASARIGHFIVPLLLSWIGVLANDEPTRAAAVALLAAYAAAYVVAVGLILLSELENRRRAPFSESSRHANLWGVVTAAAAFCAILFAVNRLVPLTPKPTPPAPVRRAVHTPSPAQLEVAKRITRDLRALEKAATQGTPADVARLRQQVVGDAGRLTEVGPNTHAIRDLQKAIDSGLGTGSVSGSGGGSAMGGGESGGSGNGKGNVDAAAMANLLRQSSAVGSGAAVPMPSGTGEENSIPVGEGSAESAAVAASVPRAQETSRQDAAALESLARQLDSANATASALPENASSAPPAAAIEQLQKNHPELSDELKRLESQIVAKAATEAVAKAATEAAVKAATASGGGKPGALAPGTPGASARPGSSAGASAASVAETAAVTPARETFKRLAQEIEKKNVAATVAATASRVRPKLPDPPRKKSETIEAFLRKLLPPLCALALAWLLLGIFRKKRPPAPPKTRTPGLDKREIDTLLETFRKLETKNLTSRQEIILKYQAFLQIMERQGNGKPEWQPPSEFAAHIAPHFREAAPAVHAVTEIFSRVLYGMQEIGGEALQRFRGDFREVLRSR